MIQHLPTLNASLNGLCTVFLLCGYLAIRRGNRDLHKRLMLLAFATSLLFLASYLTYHFTTAAVTPYAKHDWTRPLYFFILVSHIVLAAAIVPLVILTLVRALKGRFDKHKGVARITLPLWLYVSITGVAVYLMLHVFGS